MQKTLLPIQAVARKLEIPEEYFEPWGSQSGKVKLELLSDPSFRRRGKLIIVTATTPTSTGTAATRPPIVQPGAPGQSSRILTAAAAADVSRIQYTAADVQFIQEMIGAS